MQQVLMAKIKKKFESHAKPKVQIVATSEEKGL